MTMNAYFTRDSVCAGDDGDAPHARELALPAGISVDDMLRHVIRAAKLPSISGGLATWSLSSVRPLAVIAQQWPDARPLYALPPKLSELDSAGGVLRLHFSYHAQQDPEVVFEVLRRLRTRAE